MKIDRFHMERAQCLYENEVKFNLSESGVAPLTIRELIPGKADRETFEQLPLGYPYSTGRKSLRKNIARFYGCNDYECVTVMNGGSEANYASIWGIVGPSDRVAFMVPNYLQGWGVARAYGRQTDGYKLVMKREQGEWKWSLDVDSLRKAVKKNTKLIVVTNPNNPTGYVLSEEEMQIIIDEARRVGAWILSDEIYRGAEVGGGPMTPTFFGRYDKVLVTAGLSKAFGLPGLRIGWVVSKPSMIQHLCSYHDYLTLTPSAVSDYLANLVMQPKRREEVLKRTRAIIDHNLPVLEKWIAKHADIFEYERPAAGAIAMLKYRLPISPVALFNRIREEKSVLITPGPHFGIGNYLRIGYGYDLGKLRRGLREIDPILQELRARKAA
jgi:aspartate/methionine/tyrosine aminotransferase